MSTPHDLIRAIIDEDFVAAKEITNNLVFTAVSDELEVAKMEVASTLFPAEIDETASETGKRIRILRKSQRTGKPVTGKTKDWMDRSYARKLYKLKSDKAKAEGLGEGKKGSAATIAGGKGLKGNQSRIDANNNGGIDAQDLEILRASNRASKKG